MGWRKRLDRWLEDHWLWSAAIQSLIAGAFWVALQGISQGLLATGIFFVLNAAFNWARYG